MRSIMQPAIGVSAGGGGGGGGTPYVSGDAESDAFFAAAGITNATAGTAIKNMITGLRSDFAAANLTALGFDRLWFASNETQAGVVKDVLLHGDASLANGPTFSAWRGLTANNSGYFLSNFVESADAVNFAANNHSWFSYVRSASFPSTNENVFAGGFNVDFSQGRYLYLKDIAYITSNFQDDQTSVPYNTPASHKGLWLASKTDAATITLYHDSTALADYGGAPLGIPLQDFNWTFMAENDSLSGSGIFPTIDPIVMGLCGMGRGFSAAEVALIQARVNTCMDALFAI